MIKNVSFVLTAQLAARCLAYVLSLVLADRLRRDGFGVFTLGTTLSGLALAISSVGLPRILVREITRNPDAAGDLLRKSAWLRWAGALVVLGALAGYGAFAGWRLEKCAVVLLFASAAIPLALDV